MTRSRMPWEDVVLRLDDLPSEAGLSPDPVAWVLNACRAHVAKLERDRQRDESKRREWRKQYMRDYREKRKQSGD